MVPDVSGSDRSGVFDAPCLLAPTTLDAPERTLETWLDPPTRYRSAGESDLAAIVAIERAAFERPAERFHERQIRRLLNNPRARAFVAEHDGVAGWAVGLIRRHGAIGARKTGRLYAIAVHPDRTGRGYGRALAERVLHALAEEGVERVSLEVRADNTTAQRLYRSLGFVHTRSLVDYYGPGMDGLRMRRTHHPNPHPCPATIDP
ncbi:MAG: N-acetyltransferase [Phycisphaerales bacterium]|nr:MAG: N-acetyltransferase [Phycisphaerales bacterium]